MLEPRRPRRGQRLAPATIDPLRGSTGIAHVAVRRVKGDAIDRAYIERRKTRYGRWTQRDTGIDRRNLAVARQSAGRGRNLPVRGNAEQQKGQTGT